MKLKEEKSSIYMVKREETLVKMSLVKRGKNYPIYGKIILL